MPAGLDQPERVSSARISGLRLSALSAGSIDSPSGSRTGRGSIISKSSAMRCTAVWIARVRLAFLSTISSCRVSWL